MAEKTLIEGIREAMDEELARDDSVFITGEDVGPRGGVFRATLGLFAKYGPTRVIDSPLAAIHPPISRRRRTVGAGREPSALGPMLSR